MTLVRRLPLILAYTLTVACSSSPPPSPEVPVASPAPAEEPSPVETAKADKTVLSIAQSIRDACGITETETYFTYNSSAVQESSPLLSKIVECFTTGPLAGNKLALVGHADPRGDEEYNWALGGRRAENVKSRLEGLGFPKPQLSSTSRGETDASGEDESGWRRDRKVELTLGS